MRFLESEAAHRLWIIRPIISADLAAARIGSDFAFCSQSVPQNVNSIKHLHHNNQRLQAMTLACAPQNNPGTAFVDMSDRTRRNHQQTPSLISVMDCWQRAKLALERAPPLVLVYQARFPVSNAPRRAIVISDLKR